jgi:hypothetical protein
MSICQFAGDGVEFIRGFLFPSILLLSTNSIELVIR